MAELAGETSAEGIDGVNGIERIDGTVDFDGPDEIDGTEEEVADPLKGRGAGFNPANKFHAQSYTAAHAEGLDGPLLAKQETSFLEETPKKLINKIDSPDIGLSYSVNPYQGCEHGCIYCYARNAHEYWGMSAGLDFERKIVVKTNAAKMVRTEISAPRWEVRPLVLSGNTDCYQPAEKKFRLTRQILEVMREFRHPVGIITKNSLVLRDQDIFEDLNKNNLIHINVSLTSFDEDLRRRLEPRTASGVKRLEVVRRLSDAGIPVNVMLAPVIPGLNAAEIPEIVERSAAAGASSIGYTIVRLNGQVAGLFEDWLDRHFPMRKEKVLAQIRDCHGGNLADHRFGVRMRGEGKIAEVIRNIFKAARNKHFAGRSLRPYNCEAFVPPSGKQMKLW